MGDAGVPGREPGARDMSRRRAAYRRPFGTAAARHDPFDLELTPTPLRHREPYSGFDGRIWMYTRGTDFNAFDSINHLLGGGLMDALDQEMRESFRSKGGFCPS